MTFGAKHSNTLQITEQVKCEDIEVYRIAADLMIIIIIIAKVYRLMMMNGIGVWCVYSASCTGATNVIEHEMKKLNIFYVD